MSKNAYITALSFYIMYTPLYIIYYIKGYCCDMNCKLFVLMKTIKLHGTCIKIQLILEREHNPSPLERSAGWYCRSARKYSLHTARIIQNT
jgi:hypothetical protein